ncbi:lysozyme [Escherichia coli]|nr:lysozyme [Escherichia coli]PCG48182.1 lysozyme [Escherichia coli]PCG53695.1 lysozyme [Escherichia coli]
MRRVRCWQISSTPCNSFHKSVRRPRMKNNRTFSTARDSRALSAGRWQRCLRPLPLFLMMWLIGCAGPSVKYVPVKPVPIPAEWLADCLVPPVPEPFTFGASVTYNLQLLAVIKNCNVDKASIRRLETRRQHEFTDMAGTPAVPAGKTK